MSAGAAVRSFWESIICFLVANGDIITTVAPSVSALCLVLSVIIAKRAIRRARHVQKEATARVIFNDYLKHCIKYPDYAYPKGFSKSFDFSERTFQGDPKKFEQYEWFVSLMIFSMREILDILDGDPYWVLTVKRQIGYHIDYLADRRTKKEPNTDFVTLAGKKVNDIINDLLALNKKHSA